MNIGSHLPFQLVSGNREAWRRQKNCKCELHQKWNLFSYSKRERDVSSASAWVESFRCALWAFEKVAFHVWLLRMKVCIECARGRCNSCLVVCWFSSYSFPVRQPSNLAFLLLKKMFVNTDDAVRKLDLANDLKTVSKKYKRAFSKIQLYNIIV